MSGNSFEVHTWASKGSQRRNGQKSFVRSFLRAIQSEDLNNIRSQGIEELWEFQSLFFDLEIQLESDSLASPLEALTELLENFDPSNKYAEELDHLASVLENLQAHFQDEDSESNEARAKLIKVQLSKIETLVANLRYHQVLAGSRDLAEEVADTWLETLNSGEAENLGKTLSWALEDPFNRFIRTRAARFICEHIEQLPLNEDLVVSFCNSIVEFDDFRQEQEVTWLIAALALLDSFLEQELSDIVRNRILCLILDLAEGREEDSIQQIIETVKARRQTETREETE